MNVKVAVIFCPTFGAQVTDTKLEEEVVQIGEVGTSISSEGGKVSVNLSESNKGVSTLTVIK